ncbi:MAG: outer membrane beta-barrel protein, partial [Muribaculum sp.]|nr:outer membrane beta-barrel protein [Muribaculum sp.]
MSLGCSAFGGNAAGREEPDSLPMTVNLDEVSVVARKPDVAVSAEKIVYTPSATISGNSGSLYDAISSMPGVTLDASGKISINGISGVKLLIDGRKTILSGESLLNYLKSLPSTSVSRIEINSVPSARHEASGAMTTIDVVINKRRDEGFTLGFNGNLRVWKAPRAFTGIWGEYSRGKHHFALNYAFMTARNPSDLFTDRPYVLQENRMLQTYNRERDNVMHNVVAEYDLFLSDRLKAGASLNVNFYDRREKSSIITTIPSLDDCVVTDNDMRSITRNIYGNVYFKYRFSEKSDIAANYDFFNYHSDERQMMGDDDGYRLNGDMGGYVAGYVGSVDHVFKPTRQWKFITGIKTSFINIDNVGQYDDGEGAAMENLCSAFGYKENVNAVYAELQRKGAVVAVTLGVRVEQNNAHAIFSGNEAAEKCDYTIYD